MLLFKYLIIYDGNNLLMHFQQKLEHGTLQNGTLPIQFC